LYPQTRWHEKTNPWGVFRAEQWREEARWKPDSQNRNPKSETNPKFKLPNQRVVGFEFASLVISATSFPISV
jgi:hypothetical protein